MAISAEFGYLKLESDRFLKSRNPGRDTNAPEFYGVSFASVKECVLSMEELGDWKICTVPLADKIPAPLAMLSVLVPIVGVGMHYEGMHIQLQGGFKAELIRLISSIEKESWGLDLNQFI